MDIGTIAFFGGGAHVFDRSRSPSVDHDILPRLFQSGFGDYSVGHLFVFFLLATTGSGFVYGWCLAIADSILCRLVEKVPNVGIVCRVPHHDHCDSILRAVEFFACVPVSSQLTVVIEDEDDMVQDLLKKPRPGQHKNKITTVDAASGLKLIRFQRQTGHRYCRKTVDFMEARNME
mmetsp:Transcript_20929/g.43780  ORF Transcript_20929/g.43780 Transcript_20929/m.43780 type:complete len:176 (-) Transcript_20929:225-752(-)